MGNQKDTKNKVIDFTASRPKTTDPLSASVLSRYARQEKLAEFILQAFDGLFTFFKGWANRKRVTRDLSSMPDYLLRDIGIRRDEIPAIVAGKLDKGSLALSPTGDKDAPAFYKDKAKSESKPEDETPMAA